MLDILFIIHSFADTQTASRIRQTCRKLSVLIPRSVRYSGSIPEIDYEYRVGSKLHRLDGPARVYKFEADSWCRGDVSHREYHPQYIAKCLIIYAVDDAPHREVGPSFVSSCGCTWYFRGLKHRKTGPADTWHKESWYTLGKWHRLDGPAVNGIYAIRGKCHRISGSMNDQWIVDDKFIR